MSLRGGLSPTRQPLNGLARSLEGCFVAALLAMTLVLIETASVDTHSVGTDLHSAMVCRDSFSSVLRNQIAPLAEAASGPP